MEKKSEELLHKGDWLSLYKSVFKNKDGQEIYWESVRRSKDVRSMAVIAQLLPSNRFILIKQYRPAIEGYVLGFPAGLWTDDTGQAIEELKEETGYSGKIISISPELKSNTGIMNAIGCIVYMNVDEEDPVNQNPKQNLEPAEDIEVVLASIEEIPQIIEKAQQEGIAISPSLWFLFILPGCFKR